MSKVHVPTCDYLIYFISLPDVGARGVVGCHARPPQPVVFACVGAVGGRERQARRTRVVAPPVGEGPEALELGHRCFLQPEGITGAVGAAMSTLVPRSGRKQTAVAAMETASERNSKRAKQQASETAHQPRMSPAVHLPEVPTSRVEQLRLHTGVVDGIGCPHPCLVAGAARLAAAAPVKP